MSLPTARILLSARILSPLRLLALSVAVTLLVGAEPIEAPRPHTITIRVVDEAGEPLPGARIQISSPVLKAKLQADANGSATFQLPRLPDYVTFWATADGRVPLSLSWRRERGPLPFWKEFTFTLPQGTSIGGIIQEQSGQPIAGAKVLLLVPSDEALPGQTKVSLWDHEVTTDENGRWTCGILPAKLDDIWIRLTHDDYISDDRYGETTKPSLEQLRAGTGVMMMKKGVAISGQILSPDGSPVEGATIALGDDRFGSHFPTVKSDAEGQFRLPHRKPGSETLTIVKPGFAPELLRVTVSEETKPLTVPLKPGRVMKVRVTDAKGNPLPGVWVAPDTWRNCRTLTGLGIPEKTDAEGVWTWDWAPDDAVLCDILKQGYLDSRNVSLTASETLQEITLNRPLVISGTVTDATTGKPIPEFRIVPGIAWQESRISWQHREIGLGEAGKYKHSFTYPYPLFYVRIEADGYLPAVTRAFQATEGAVTENLTLRRGESLTGVVRAPDGKPLKDATIYYVTADSTAYVRNGSSETNDVPTTTTDAAGKFTFPPTEENDLLLILDERGYASVPKAELPEDGVIALRPWAKVQGQVKVGSRVGAGETISLNAYESIAQGQPSIYWDYSATADGEGNFEFSRVPAAKFGVARQISNSENTSTYITWETVQPKPGETVTVQIGGVGRPVVGRFVAPPENEDPIAWNYGMFHASQKKPGGLTGALGALGNLLGAEKSERRNYALQVKPNGEFRIDDLVPGTYELTASIAEPPTPNTCGFGESIATVKTTFSIPPIPGGQADDPLDLGDLPGTLIKNVKVGDVAPEFTVTDLDGTSVSLSDYRGKYVYLEFWATWCGPCMAEMPNLKEAHERFKNNDRLVMLGMNMDDRLETAKATTEKQEIDWRTGYVGSWESPIVGSYGVRGIPASFLIGPDGKVIAKDLRGQTLADMLQKHLPTTVATPVGR